MTRHMSGEYISVSNGKRLVSNVNKRAKMFAVCAWMQIAVSHLVIEREEPATYLLPGSIKRDDNLTDSLQRFWETESIGIKNDTFSETQTTEFLPEIHFDKGEGRYKVNLPWKLDCFPKSTGYGMCVNRLRQQHSRLKKGNTLLEEYNKVIHQQINSGIIESVLEKDDNEGYYLPHHGE